MTLEKPKYAIEPLIRDGMFNRNELEEVLEALPLSIAVTAGHDLSIDSRTSVGVKPEMPSLFARHYAQVIELKPFPGMRLFDASFSGEHASAFTPSRVMDEVTGGGACCSYSFNSKDLGLPYDVNLSLDIKKLG